MSEHHARVAWQRGGADFAYESYGRSHEWQFGTGSTLRASAAAEYRGDPALPNPEEAFVAALSSCHMLTFLALAARRGLVVDAYDDEAVGHLEKNAEGRLAVTRVVLRPRVRFAGPPPDAAALAALHEQAHQGCFIANSVTTDVRVGAPAGLARRGPPGPRPARRRPAATALRHPEPRRARPGPKSAPAPPGRR